MKKIVSIIVFFLAGLVFVPLAQARLEATVDRDQLALDETFTLTLTRDGGSAFSSVDLKPLTRDFEIIGRSQGSTTRIINGNMTSSFTLTLTLAPKHSGTLRIPPLTVGGEKSRPLTVEVTMAQPRSRADNAPVFIETSVDKKRALLQEQVILTLRIYWAVNAEINEPKAPSLPDAMIEQLKDATYSKVINGRTYKVFERKYAIFPQKAGELTIPPLTVRATLPGRQQRPDIFPDIFDDFFKAQGRRITLHSKQEKITVKKKAPGYPAGAVWLPTGKLSVAVDWSRDPSELEVGESTTLNISLAGQGLLAAQLPPVRLPEMPGIKVYQGKAEVKNLKNDGGVTGLRKESIALVPTRPGTVTMPEIRIPWWNKDRDRLEYLTIPARKLVIRGGTGTSSPAGVVSPPVAPKPGVAAEPAMRPAATTKAPASSRSPHMVWWLMACGILALAWLVTLVMLFKTRSRLQALGHARERQDDSDRLREREAFKSLARACQNNDPSQARQALTAWAGSRFPGERVQVAGDLERLFPGKGLAGQLEAIDRALYGAETTAWSGEELLTLVKRLRRTDSTAEREDSPLPPLYR